MPGTYQPARAKSVKAGAVGSPAQRNGERQGGDDENCEPAKGNWLFGQEAPHRATPFSGQAYHSPVRGRKEIQAGRSRLGSRTSSLGSLSFEEYYPLRNTRTSKSVTPRYSRATPDVWCPGDLLIGALNARLMLTFLYQMQRRKLEVLTYKSSAQGTIDHSDGKHRVTQIVVQPHISLKSGNDLEAAREAIRDTVDSCMISNSILATVQVDPNSTLRWSQPSSASLRRRPLTLTAAFPSGKR